MPNAREIKRTMKSLRIPSDRYPGDVMSLIGQMDEQLSYEQCLAVMQEQGCCKDEGVTAPFKAFCVKYADKSITEKLEHFDEIESGHKPGCHLNSDGTLSIYWNGWDAERKQCVCRFVKRLYTNRGGPVHVSKTFCGCCAGHARNTIQCALSVKLRLRDIVSSPISSGGKEQCEFLFEIIK